MIMGVDELIFSSGFGFVTYATDEEVENCQNNRPHVIDGKQVRTILISFTKQVNFECETATGLFWGDLTSRTK